MTATKELQAFWHWFDGEDPPSDEASDKAEENMCGLANQALSDASWYIAKRAGLMTNEESLVDALDTHPEALRDLSLALCAALERMREVVPEAKREDPVLAFTGKPQVYWDEVAALPDRAFIAGRQSGKSDRIRQMQKLLDEGKVSVAANIVCTECGCSTRHGSWCSKYSFQGTK